MANRTRNQAVAAMWSAVSVLAASGFSSPAVASAAQREGTIVVHVDNYAGVPAKDLTKAELIADRVYDAIGVRVIWVHEEASDDPPGLRVHLRLLSRDMADRKISKERIPDDVLGQAIPASQCAYILFHRIPHVAVQEGHDYRRVLGLVVAHELGHIVLPTEGHSETGVMNRHVYLRSKYNLVYFTNEQGEAIRGLLMKLAGN